MLLILFIILFVITISGVLNVGWLMTYSIGVFLYCCLIFADKTRVLNSKGKMVCIISLFGIAYSICVLKGVDIISLF